MNLPLDAQARLENAQRLMSGPLGGFGGIVLWGFGVAAAAALVAVSYDWALQPAGSGAKPLVLAAFLAIVHGHQGDLRPRQELRESLR